MGYPQQGSVRHHSSVGARAHGRDGVAGIARSRSWWMVLEHEAHGSTKTSLMYATRSGVVSSITPDTPLGTDPLHSIGARGSLRVGTR